MKATSLIELSAKGLWTTTFLCRLRQVIDNVVTVQLDNSLIVFRSV